MKKQYESMQWDELWYEVFPDANKLERYPKEFIEWVKQEDTWAYTYTLKYKFESLYELFGFYLKEF